MTHSDEALPGGHLLAPVVLVVDDEPELRMTTTTALESSGFQVLQAGDGVEAVHQYRTHRWEIALVLMDIVMPNMGGIEAALLIRGLNPSAKVILTSGYSNRLVSDAQPDAFLPKPYKLSTLFEVIQKVLDGSIQAG